MTFKRTVCAIAAGVGFLSAAQAADLPFKAMPIGVQAPETWTGVYAGVHLGAVWHRNGTSIFGSGGNDEGPWDSSANGPIGNARGNGFIGGVQIGYNFQKGNTLLGLEASLSRLTGMATKRDDLLNGVGAGNIIESRIDWLATFRGRVGWLALPDTLLYFTGGLAVGNVKNAASPSGLNNGGFTTATMSAVRVGYVVGAGLERRLNRDWSIGVEGLYVDLGSSSAPWAGNQRDNGITVHTHFRNSAVIGLLKINRAF